MKKAVLISCFDWYEKRLKPVRNSLLDKGYEVKVLLSDFNHTKKQRYNKFHEPCTYFHVPIYKKNISLKRIISHFSFARQSKTYIEKYKPDIIYCLVPPNKVVDYCSSYKKRNPKVIFIIDIIDMWPESMPTKRINGFPFVKQFMNHWMKWRDNAIKNADYVFTECNLYREKLSHVLNPAKTATLYLFKEQSDHERKLVLDIINRKKNDDVIRFAYIGSMNHIIDITSICRVIATIVNKGKRCELHAIGGGESRKKFEREVKAIGCHTYFYGFVYDEIKKISIIAPCDYAFNMMKSDISVGLTIKSIDYLSYGLPLINNIKGDTWQLIESEKIGVNIDDNTIINIPDEFQHHEIIKCYEQIFTKKAFTDIIYRILNY
ncbi:hypothetical protein [Selenomonas sp. AE3005]|uniref:hypothetical protein n=1 Tax=Selenomonas sp. AE3005 TaxID=1485543 RepID=UPI0025E2D310|nr:hypothetical protein [Selenomonas sp. AE3005]